MDLIISEKNAEEIKKKQVVKLIEEVRYIRHTAVNTLSYLDLVSDERTQNLFTQLAELLTIADSVLEKLTND